MKWQIEQNTRSKVKTFSFEKNGYLYVVKKYRTTNYYSDQASLGQDLDNVLEGFFEETEGFVAELSAQYPNEVKYSYRHYGFKSILKKAMRWGAKGIDWIKSVGKKAANWFLELPSKLKNKRRQMFNKFVDILLIGSLHDIAEKIEAIGGSDIDKSTLDRVVNSLERRIQETKKRIDSRDETLTNLTVLTWIAGSIIVPLGLLVLAYGISHTMVIESPFYIKYISAGMQAATAALTTKFASYVLLAAGIIVAILLGLFAWRHSFGLRQLRDQLKKQEFAHDKLKQVLSKYNDPIVEYAQQMSQAKSKAEKEQIKKQAMPFAKKGAKFCLEYLRYLDLFLNALPSTETSKYSYSLNRRHILYRYYSESQDAEISKDAQLLLDNLMDEINSKILPVVAAAEEQ